MGASPDDSLDLEARWRDALRAGEAGLFEWDTTGRVVTVFPPDSFGAGIDGPIAYERFLDCVHAEDRSRVDASLQAALAGTTRYRDEYRTVAGVWLSVRGQAVSRTRVLAVFGAEGERRRADEARIRAIQDLSVAARSSEVFASMLAHDLKNPINVVMATAHMLLEGPPGMPTHRALDRIRANAERLTKMIGHLRDYARGRPGSLALERTETDLAAVVERAITASNVTPRPPVVVKDDTRGSWDEARLEHAIVTLLESAAEQAAELGVPIRVAVDGSDEMIVSLSIAHDGTVPAPVVENAFRPFGADGADQGLGLFAARQAIAAHGGEIAMESNEGAGTRILAHLPRRLAEVTGAIAADVWDEILSADRSTGTPTSVTAALYGALPLHQRAPVAYWKIFERYAAVFDDAVNRRVYRGDQSTANGREETRAIAEMLGALGAGAQEVAEIHARALRSRLRGASPGRGQALIGEGRLLAFELMGHLVTWYRRRSTFGAPETRPADEAE